MRSIVCQTGVVSVPLSFRSLTSPGPPQGLGCRAALVSGLPWSSPVSPVIVSVVVNGNSTGQFGVGLGAEPYLDGLSLGHLFGRVQHDVCGVVIGDLYYDMLVILAARGGEDVIVQSVSEGKDEEFLAPSTWVSSMIMYEPWLWSGVHGIPDSRDRCPQSRSPIPLPLWR